MPIVKQHLVFLVAAVLVGGSLAGCSSSDAPGTAVPAGGGSGGRSSNAGSGGNAQSGTGGTAGRSTAGGAGMGGATGGSSGASGGSDGTAAGGSGGNGSGGSGGAPEAGGAGGDGAMGGNASTPETDGSPSSDASDAAAGDAPGGKPGALAACWPDSKVIKICHQLENACENCGLTSPKACNKNTNTPAAVCGCFALVDKAYAGQATDEDCAKYAADNKCTVDNVTTTGNVCGSLNCEAPGCKCTTPNCDDESNKGKTCAADQHWGDSSACQKWATKCPCK